MRKKLLPALLIILSLYAIPSSAQQTVFINELMASNDTTIADNTGSYEDWIELYNSGSTPFLLDGYYISNDATDLIKYQLSGNLQIPANGYLILWASNSTPDNRHLPFKVSASGESVYLTLPDGVTVADAATAGPQKTDISYGRTTNGAADFSFFKKPTPGASNNGSTAYLGYLNPPVFSTSAGFYANPFSLSISSGDAEAQIIYTVDGSNPDAGNLGGVTYRYKNQYPQNPGNAVGAFLTDSYTSNTYVNPINITDASVKPNKLSIKSSTCDVTPLLPTTIVNKGTVVRAMAVKAGYISSTITTATYFVTTGGINKYTLPVLSIAIPENQLYSWDDGIFSAGTDFEQWRAQNPALALPFNYPANWRRETEFPASMELFTANKTTREIQRNFGFGINGNSSRAKAQKSVRVYFRGEYGASDIDYSLFSDLPYKNYERLVLSNAGQDFNYGHMRAMIMQNAVKHLKMDTQHDFPSIVFINGEFWGFQNTRERFDNNYFEQVYGIKKEELDFIENERFANNGNTTAIVSLRSFIAANDLSQPANYLTMKQRVDMENFIDYNVTEIYFGNKDWPHNNMEYFRKRVPYSPDAPYGHDGKFRWVLNDMDVALNKSGSGGIPYNSLAWATGTRTDENPAAWSTIMLRKLLANTEFRNQFVSRYADLLNTTFLPSKLGSVIYHYRDLLNPHIAEHVQRWRQPSSVSSWNTEVNGMIQFANERPSYALQHIKDQFGLSDVQQLTIDVSDTIQGFIAVNSIDITPAFPGVPAQAYPWSGRYFPEVPVTLIAKPKQGYRFSHWEGGSVSTEDTITITLASAMSFKAVFENSQEALPKVFNYWHFNNLPSGTLTSVAADSTVPGNAFITYEGTGAGFMDRTGTDQGSNLNLQFAQPLGFGLRPRNPSATRVLRITAPTTGFKNIVLNYATTRTTSGAENQRVLYTTDNINWQLKADNIVVPSPETTFGLQTFDFSDDAATADNPNFAVRIEFFGTNAVSASGNDRFDNIGFSGIALQAQVTPPAITVVSDKNSVCSNSQVTFTASISNAGASPSYQWIKNGANVGDNSNTFQDNSFQNSDNIYCVLTANSVTVNSNHIIIIVVPNSLIISSLSKTSVSACANDGIITINSSGGYLPYLYSLDNVNYSSTGTFTNLASGAYTAYVKDVKGCSASFADVLTKASTLTVSSLTRVSPSACLANGSITINRSGGTAPILYSLNNVDYFTSNVFSNLGAGTYTTYVKDARGCVATRTDVLNATSPLTISSFTKVSASSCSSDGSITINRSGGTAPYLYSLNNVDFFTSNLFSNLAGGTYTAYVKDAKGCIATRTDVLNAISPLVVSSFTKVSPASCRNNGSITINRSGGTAPYLYSLNNVDFFTSNVFTNLGGGNYTGYVKDAKGCIASRTDVLTQPASSLTVSSLTRVSASACRNDGSIQINRSGGTSPFTYSLDNVNYFTSNLFSNLAGGNYTAYVKDAQGCVATRSDVISQPAALLITNLIKTQASACRNDGAITIYRSGGTSPVLYSLDNVNYFTSTAFSNLAAGNYTAYAKDARGCIATFSDVVTKVSTLILSSVTKKNPTACSTNGTLTINKSGGSSSFQYSLNNVNYFTSNVFSNLGAGTYTAYVKDGKNCVASLGNIVLTAPACGTFARSSVEAVTIPAKTPSKLTIKVFPNPTAEKFSIIAESASDKEVEVTVMDVLGRKVFHTRTAVNNTIFFGEKLRAGVYIIQALQNRERATLKIVKLSN